jgi:hypothetical protein
MPTKRKPTNLHLLKGTFDKRYHADRIDNTLSMLPAETIIDPPCMLKTDEAKALWNQYIARFTAWGILSDVDLVELERGIWFHEQLRRAQNWLETCETREAEDQALVLIVKLSKEVSRIFSQFGVTPLERTRLTLTTTCIKKELSILDLVKRTAEKGAFNA